MPLSELKSLLERYSSAKAGILLITSQADVFSEHPEEKSSKTFPLALFSHANGLY